MRFHVWIIANDISGSNNDVAIRGRLSVMPIFSVLKHFATKFLNDLDKIPCLNIVGLSLLLHIGSFPPHNVPLSYAPCHKWYGTLNAAYACYIHSTKRRIVHPENKYTQTTHSKNNLRFQTLLPLKITVLLYLQRLFYWKKGIILRSQTSRGIHWAN